MTDVTDGFGNAQDASVVTSDDVAALSLAQEGPADDQEDPRKAAEDAVAAAEAKIEQQKAHLAGAEQALEVAKADLAALDKEQ